MMGEIVAWNMYSKAIVKNKTQLLHLVGLISHYYIHNLIYSEILQ